MRKSAARYRKAREFLGRLVDWERQVGLTFSDETMRLDLFRESLASLGNPDRNYRIAIVAGTKGKGSTAAILARLIRAHGFKTGLFSSPHLVSVRERIQVDGEWISKEHFADAVDALQTTLPYFDEPGKSRTYFESLTAAGLCHFAKAGCEVVVLEVGLGGRLDATNATKPDVSVITPISRDHFQTLGRTFLKIAAEKAGILRPRVPAVIGRQRKDVRDYFRETVAGLGAPALFYGDDFRAVVREVTAEGTRFRFEAGDDRQNYTVSLLGDHQAWNAATALSALPGLGIEPDRERTALALASVSWPGRGEIVAADPPVLLDGAHNGDSASVLARLVGRIFPRQPCVVLFAGSKGKEYPLIFKRLRPFMSEVFLTESTHPRRLPAAELEEVLKQAAPGVPVRNIPDWRIALPAARAAQRGRPLVITGSLYLAGEVRGAFPRGLAAAEAQ